MVRTADHDVRRRQIVEGVKRMALDSGLGRVTMAGAAQAAGVSVGLVQHYYASKHALLVDALTTVRSDVLARVEAEVSRAEARHERIEQMVLAGLLEMLPLDDRRRDETYLVHAFAGLALDDDALCAALQVSDRALQDRVATAIGNGRACGEVLPATDPVAAAYDLMALEHGLAAKLLTHTGPDDRRWAAQALTRRLAELFPGECTRWAGSRESAVESGDMP